MSRELLICLLLCLFITGGFWPAGDAVAARETSLQAPYEFQEKKPAPEQEEEEEEEEEPSCD